MKRKMKNLTDLREIEGYTSMAAMGTDAIGRFSNTLNSLHATLTDMSEVLIAGVKKSGSYPAGCIVRGQAHGRTVEITFSMILLDDEEVKALEAGTLTREMLQAADVLDDVREADENTSIN